MNILIMGLFSADVFAKSIHACLLLKKREARFGEISVEFSFSQVCGGEIEELKLNRES